MIVAHGVNGIESPCHFTSDQGHRARRQRPALADDAVELGILLAGPNGQGVVSTPAKLCAQLVAPYPPAGHIGVASQSGNFVSSFLNWSRATGVGISRAVSAGNAAAVTVADYLDFYADDPHTAVGLAYVEGIADGRAFYDRMKAIAARKPMVVVKGGATSGGARAAASHTGSLSTDDRVFDGAMRQAGVIRAATVEEAFEAAATFATQPIPKGNRVVVMTSRPGKIKEILDVKSVREAEQWDSHSKIEDVMDLESFVHLRTRICKSLREEHAGTDH